MSITFQTIILTSTALFVASLSLLIIAKTTSWACLSAISGRWVVACTCARACSSTTWDCTCVPGAPWRVAAINWRNENTRQCNRQKWKYCKHFKPALSVWYQNKTKLALASVLGQFGVYFLTFNLPGALMNCLGSLKFPNLSYDCDLWKHLVSHSVGL